MKNCIIIILSLFFGSNLNAQTMKTLYDFKANTIDGKVFDFKSLTGKKVLIVNTASKCGLTPQYTSLEELHKAFGGDKFVVIGFPANNFGEQEPGHNAEIDEFCTKNYGVSFQMMEKISVKGDDSDPLYKWLTQKELNGVSDNKMIWNFQKFLIDENGKLVKSVHPQTSPVDDEITNWVQGK